MLRWWWHARIEDATRIRPRRESGTARMATEEADGLVSVDCGLLSSGIEESGEEVGASAGLRASESG